jgi:hypothetical protein
MVIGLDMSGLCFWWLGGRLVGTDDWERTRIGVPRVTNPSARHGLWRHRRRIGGFASPLAAAPVQRPVQSLARAGTKDKSIRPTLLRRFSNRYKISESAR